MSLAQNITKHYGGDWRGNEGFIPSPGHSAKDRGTTVRDGDNGDVVFHSFNNGDWRALKDECRNLGLLPERPANGADRPAWRTTGTYEYVGADGAVAYRTVRQEKQGERKRFMAQRPDGRGGWVNGLGDAERVLYRLPDILAALADEPIYFVEGERKADRLADMGFTATAIAFGCKGWRSEYAGHLKGRRVIILPDNDDAGREFAEKVKEAVGGVIVALPGLPPRGDIIDWTGTAGDLRALVAGTVNPPAKLLPLLDPGAWQRMETPAREWALDEWIPHRQATYLTGPGSAGKSLLTQQLCTCIALGLPFMGVETRQAVAIYVTCEDDADELHRRQKAICASLGVSLSALSGKLHLVSLLGAIGNELATFTPDGRMSVGETYRTVQATAAATGAGFMALDNVAHLFAGNENIRNQVAAFCALLNQLAHDIDGSVLFLGHPNKAGDSFSGSTAWENQVRSRLFLETPKDEHGNALDPDARALSRGKANYARNGERLAFRWHKWAFINDDDIPKDQRAEIAATIQASSDNEIFLRCLEERNRQERAVSENKASRTYAPKEFAAMDESKRIGRARLEAAMDRLFRISAIERGFLWRDGGEGKDKFGLRRASADRVAQPADLPADLPLTPPADVPMTTRRPPLSHTPYINISGAGLGAAAPFREEGGRTTPAPAPPGIDNLPKSGGVASADDDDANPAWDDEPYRGKGL